MSNYYQRNREEYFCWACDFSKISGEGRLANLFIKKFDNSYKMIKVYTTDNFESKYKLINIIIRYKYISPLVGIFFCWFFFFKKKNIVYINYLPLWNLLLFILLPPRTILGPITGGAKFNKNYQYFLRKYFFILFYKASELCLLLRRSKINFSTDLLKNYINRYTLSKSKFNYIFNFIKKNSKEFKNNDFLIYYKKHLNKENLFPFQFIKKLVSLNYKILVVGDNLKIFGVKNIGFIDNKKVNSLLSKTFFSISSGENPYSLFSIECINNHVKIIAEKKQKKEFKFFKDSFLFLDYEKIYGIKDMLKKTNNFEKTF